MRPLPEIGVVILHRGDLSRTAEARASLEGAGHRRGETWGAAQFQFAGDAAALEREFGPNRVILEREDASGLASLSNRGLRAALEAGSDYVLLLDASCCLEKNALAPLLMALEAQRFAGVACPALIQEGNATVFSFGGEASGWTGCAKLSLNGAGKDAERLRHWETAGFAPYHCAIFKREFLEDIGLFNEAYGSLAFDAELGLRAKSEHWSIIAVPQSIASISPEMERPAGAALEMARNTIWLLRAYGAPVKRFPALLTHMAFTWPLAFAGNILRGRFRAAGAVVKGSFQGLFSGAFRDGRHFALPVRGRKQRAASPSPSAFVMKYLL